MSNNNVQFENIYDLLHTLFIAGNPLAFCMTGQSKTETSPSPFLPIFPISNLKFLKTDYKHNKLIVQTLISPNILRYLLVSVYFNELDLSHADFTEEISIDLSYKHVMNHNIKITSNSQLEIKNSTE